MKDFDSFKRDAVENRIFIRASKANWEKLTKEQKNIVRNDIKRSKAAYNVINDVQKELEKIGARFVIFKTLDSYPDIGLDVDILVNRDMNKVMRILMEKFNGEKIMPSVAMALSKKASFSIPESPITIEFHEGKFSQVGEYTIPGSQLIKRSRNVKFYGVSLRTVSPEDQLLITVVHRMYRHLNVRFSDVYNVAELMKRKKLDWEYILSTAKRCNIFPGLVLFMTLTKRYGHEINNFKKFPRAITTKQFLYLHSSRIFHDLLGLRIGSAIKLATIYPTLLVLRMIMARLFDRGNLIW